MGGVILVMPMTFTMDLEGAQDAAQHLWVLLTQVLVACLSGRVDVEKQVMPVSLAQ